MIKNTRNWIATGAIGVVVAFALVGCDQADKAEREKDQAKIEQLQRDLEAATAEAEAARAKAEAPTAEAEAPTAKRVKWKMQSAFGSSLPHLGASGVRFSDDVKRLSGGDFDIKLLGGRVAPGDCSPEALTRSGQGDFHHPAPPLMCLVAIVPLP